MASRSLVLGGGGITGLAWEAGMVAGLAECGVDLRIADSIVGTSAGSLVGAWLASGRDPEEPASGMAEAPAASPAPARGSAPTTDPVFSARVFHAWASIERYAPEAGRRVGALAARAPTLPEGAWVDSIRSQLGIAKWPAGLRVTAISIETGERRVFDASSGVALERAVAASCAVPGVFPPIEIEGVRYMDGAVSSGSHADLAPGGDARTLVIAPFAAHTPGIGRLMEHALRQETAGLRAGGTPVDVVVPSPEALERIGPNALDVARRPAAVEAGRAQGRELAQRLEGWR